MVSTRGVKFKFAIGEKVLCYEPDPTKAKVLYDSKILELSVSRDNRGRKIPEYLIHFHGWSSSWDRCVKESLILRNTDENRNLQVKLASEAVTLIKGKKKQPPVIRNSLAKREKDDERGNGSPDVKQEDSSSEEEETSEGKASTVVHLPLTKSLVRILKRDYDYVYLKNKLINIPCEKNIISILEAYFRYEMMKLIHADPPKSSRTGKEVMSENIEAKIKLYKEFVDGIRIYIDFVLPRILLYEGGEREQYTAIAKTCLPIKKVKSEEPTVLKSEVLEALLSISVNLSRVNKEPVKILASPQSRASPQILIASPQVQEEETEVSCPTSPKLRASCRAPQTKEQIKKGLKAKIPGSRKGLRSADRSKSVDESGCHILSTSPTASEQDLESSPPHHNPESSPSGSPSRKTRRCTLRSVAPDPSLSPVASSSSSRSPMTPNLISSLSAIAISNQPVVNLKPLPHAMAVSNFSSSTSSTHSSSSCLKDRKPIQLANSKLLKEVLEWRLLPDQLYTKVPAELSLIYGASHLLRLLVEMPQLLSKTNMPRQKKQLLYECFENFIRYLDQEKDELFPESMYMDSCDLDDTNDSE